MPDWFKKIKNIVKSANKAVNDVEQFQNRAGTVGGATSFTNLRCFIDGLPMELVPVEQPTFLKWPEGAKVYRCPRGHEFSPGSNPVNSPPLPPKPGAEHGEI